MQALSPSRSWLRRQLQRAAQKLHALLPAAWLQHAAAPFVAVVAAALLLVTGFATMRLVPHLVSMCAPTSWQPCMACLHAQPAGLSHTALVAAALLWITRCATMRLMR